MPMSVLVYHPSKTGVYVRLLREQGFEEALLPCRDRAEAEAAMPEAEALFCWRFPPDLLPRARRLRWIQAMGAGVEDLIRAPIPEGAVLTRVEGLFGGYMSEYVLGYILHRTLKIEQAQRLQRAQWWAPYEIERVAGKRVGIAGTGQIGGDIARRCRALGMEVWGLSRSGASPEADRSFRSDEILTFAAGVDFLVNVLPLTPETTGLFGAAVFRAMKPGALFLNIGRAATVETGALLESLTSGHLGGAVLDVFDEEPLPAESLLWKVPNLAVTPHVSGPSVPAEVAAYFVANWRRWRRGEPLQGVVDRTRGD
jgi:glyoxylate/hydroxypyruvate reductase